MNLVDNNGNVITDVQFRANNPYISFPATLTQDVLTPYGYNLIQSAAIPTPSSFYGITEGAPTQVDGIWTQTWVQMPVSLATAQSIQSTILNSACAEAIVSGFVSSALGAVYTYPSGFTDQQNLASSILASIMPSVTTGWTTPFWCADSNGNWAWVEHTAAQIQQVGIDGKSAVLAYQSQNATLQAQLTAATTIAEVEAVVWP